MARALLTLCLFDRLRDFRNAGRPFKMQEDASMRGKNRQDRELSLRVDFRNAGLICGMLDETGDWR
jgi:hypothetical protein